MMKIKNILLLSLVLLGALACSDWFDVTPKTSIKSDKFFADEAGFQSALTGCYVRMTNDETYGKELTWYFMEKLVQRYDDNVGQTTDIYDYKDKAHSKNKLSSIWLEMYRTIANINNLLSQLEDHGRDVIKTDGYFELMKGEALALRAYHHFDLLRMFGPIYKDNPTALSIPYRTKFTDEKAPLLSAEKVLDNVLNDLKEADKLLAKDSLVWSRNTSEPFMGYRGHRMNKYAVKALLARVYLYRGQTEDLAEATKFAKQVIDESGLSLVRDNSNDITMFDETLFGLHIHNKAKRVNDYFSVSGARNGPELWVTVENAKQLFEAEQVGINDIRYRENYGFHFGGQNGLMTRKHLEGPSTAYNEKMPLIRLAEMYLIVAEASKDVSYLNKLRNVRGISRINNVQFSNDKDMLEALKTEYRKEFFAEGQFFYFLKRHGERDFYRSVIEMTEQEYVFPLPDDEKEYGWTTE